MSKTRYQRRKEDRPHEITAAALDAFAEKGYAATRVEEVAKRAGVSKGLLYLYFKTKEELFKAVIKSVVVHRVDALIEAADSTSLSSSDFIRGPLASLLKQVPRSPIAIVIRLLVAEGKRHPELATYYYDNVVAKGLTAVSALVQRGIERGEFRKTAVTDQPQLFLAPVMLSIIWRGVFSQQHIDTDRLIETQLELILAHIGA